MDSYLLPVSLIVAGVVVIALGLYKLNSMDYSKSNTQNSCDALLQQQLSGGLKNGDNCAIWDGAQCRKGKYNNGQCAAAASSLVLVAVVLGLILIIAGIVLVFKHHNAEEKKSVKEAFLFF